MRRPRHRQRQRQRSENRRAWIIIALAAFVLVAVVGAALWFRPARLGNNGCAVDNHSAPVAKTVILLDQTDALPAAELSYVRRLVMNEYFWLPTGGALTIRLISAEVPEGVSALTACRISDGSDSLGIIDNPAAVHKEYERKVGGPLNAFLSGMATQPEQKASPILEAITATMADAEFGSDITARRLVIVSDLAQNSLTYSQYGRRPAGFALTPAQANVFDARFADTAVRLQYVRRPKLAMQGDAHRAFWTRYFTTRGSSDVAIGHDLGLGENGDRKIWYETDARAVAAKKKP